MSLTSTTFAGGAARTSSRFTATPPREATNVVHDLPKRLAKIKIVVTRIEAEELAAYVYALLIGATLPGTFCRPRWRPRAHGYR
jgi:hypothetical protein